LIDAFDGWHGSVRIEHFENSTLSQSTAP